MIQLPIEVNPKMRLFALFFAVFVLGLWELAGRLDFINTQIFPTPFKIGLALYDLCVNGYRDVSILEHLFSSVSRLLVAFFFALIIAIPLGLLSGLNGYIKAILEPVVNFLKPLPPLGYYGILILWLGIDESPKITLLFLSAFAPLFLSVSQAINKINMDYINSALSSGANKKQIFYYVILPFILPDVFIGARIALGVGYSALVAAEMIAAQSGVGWLILDASKFLYTDIMYAGVLLIGITGILLDSMIVCLKNKFIHWEGK